jgi:hypothetical protein
VFTREELVAALPTLSVVDSPPMEIVEFGHQDFESSCSEQCIWAFRGLKQARAIAADRPARQSGRPTPFIPPCYNGWMPCRPQFRLSTLLWVTLAATCWFEGMQFCHRRAMQGTVIEVEKTPGGATLTKYADGRIRRHANSRPR